MAETFTIPKRFTKEWFGYVWDYYRYFILAGIVIILLAVMTISDVAGREKFDDSINFVSEYVIDTETAEKIEALSGEGSCDLDGNGEVNILISQFNFTEEAKKDPNIDIALRNKLMATFMTKDEYIYIFDKKMMEEYVNLESTEGLFAPVEKWSENIGEDELFGASLKNSTVFKKAGVNSEDLYVLVRECYDTDNEELVKKQKNAIDIANFLLK